MPARGDPDAGRQPAGGGERVALLAVPYALWGNRGEGGMRVWLPALLSGSP